MPHPLYSGDVSSHSYLVHWCIYNVLHDKINLKNVISYSIKLSAIVTKGFRDFFPHFLQNVERHS